MSSLEDAQPEISRLVAANQLEESRFGSVLEDLSQPLGSRFRPTFSCTDSPPPENQHQCGESRDQWEPLILLRFLAGEKRAVEECPDDLSLYRGSARYLP